MKARTAISYIPPAIYTASSTVSTPHQGGNFITIYKPMLTLHSYPKLVVYIRVRSWGCTVCWFRQFYNDRSHEIKRRLLLGKKVMTNLDSIFKSRDITLPTKVRLVQAMVFPVVMYGCESWTVKKAECRRIDAFELWCWRRLLRVLGLQGDPTSPF